MTKNELYTKYLQVYGKDFSDPAEALKLGMHPQEAMAYASNVFFLMGQARDWGHLFVNNDKNFMVPVDGVDVELPENGDYS